MRLALVIPLILLAGAGTATMRIQDMAGGAAEPKRPPTSRLSTSIEDDLEVRQARLNQQARALDLKEKMIAATAKRMAAEAPALPAVPTEAEAAGQPVAARPGVRPVDERVLQVARVYQAMKPREAAAVFERLDPALQVRIASQMRERSVASVMAAMSPEAASTLTAALAGMASRPAAPVTSDGRSSRGSGPAPSSPEPTGPSRSAAPPGGA